MHKHAKFIKAFVDGKTVLCNEQDLNETQVFNNTWVKVERLSWFDLDGVNFKIEGESLPEGYTEEECPEGYVGKITEEPLSCEYCAMYKWDVKAGACAQLACLSSKRKDGQNVVFIRKEDVK